MNAKDNLLRTIKNNHPEWVPFGMESVVNIGTPVVERSRQAGRDDFGCLWDLRADTNAGTYPAERDFVITDLSNWKNQVIFPDIHALKWDEWKERIKPVDRETNLVQIFCEMGLFERSYLLMGMEEALMVFHTNPEEMYELCGAIADYKIALLKKCYEIMPFDLLWYGDDWGNQNNLFISPEAWRKIIKPHTQRIYDAAKSLGALVNQHSCGKIELIFEDMCQIGADIWNPCQPCNDLAALKRIYGDRICFCGGVDSQFVLDNPAKTAEDVKNEVIRRIDEMAFPNGGYIIAPSHAVPYDKEKLDALRNTAHEYGRMAYRR